MEDTALKQPTMVSRLPKFGSRAPSAAGPLANGSALPVPSAGGKGVNAGKLNGVIRPAPSLPMKWKKDSGEKVPDAGDEAHVQQQQLRPTVTVKDGGKPSVVSVGKARRSIPIPPNTGPIPQSTRANPRTNAPKLPSPSQPLFNRRAGVNGVSSGLPRPSSSTLSLSSDSLKSISVENVGRSQSFSHLKSTTTPANPPLTRSFSFNRAAELAKELPRPLAKSPLARSPVIQPPLVLTSERGDAFSVMKPAVTTTTCSMPPTALKKSLLPNSTKPSAISYKLMRPSLLKQPRTGQSGKVQVKVDTDRDSQEPAPHTSELSSHTENDGPTPDEAKDADGIQGLSLEGPEDMSLSSTSSLERNDMSEEYIDDFDDLGNGIGIQLLSAQEGGTVETGLFEDDSALVSQSQEGSSVTSLHSFLSETVDWAEMGLTGGRMDASPHCATRMSAGGDLGQGSSLDLSPSDSSGGTYMWDEEVLEPLGGAALGCGSYDSDLNSIDILNNLENLGSCDLEDDDLMLDVDLPEDASLHSDVDGVSRYEHSERGYWPGRWRRRQPCWGRPDQHLNNNRGGVRQSFDDCHMQGPGRRGSGHASLDELMLKHMAQDCSSVKEQLLELRRLLQTEEDGSVDESVELDCSPSSEEPSCQQQVEELLKEVQNLREDLKAKERLISKLTQQMSAPLEVPHCHCPQGELQSLTLQDKSTQTPWKTPNPQILQPSRTLPRGRHKLERPSSQVLTGAPSEHVDTQSGYCPVKAQSCARLSLDSAILLSAAPTTAPAAATVSAAAPSSSCGTLQDSSPNEVHRLLNTHLTINDPHGPAVRAGNAHFGISDSLSPRVQVSGCIQLQRENGGPGDLHRLQQLSCIQRTAALVRAQGGRQISLVRGGGVLGKTDLQTSTISTSRTRHMPPPSRGLPCISSAPPVSVLAPAANNVHIRGLRPNPGRAQPCNSRLPKPKSH